MNRNFKKLLASIMAAVMVMCAVPSGGIDFESVFVSRAGAKDINSCSVGDIITYGSYPQSKVMDSSLISALETAGNQYQWISYNYYSGTGYRDDGKMKPDEDMMLYKDIPYNNDKYRAVWIKKYRPYHTGYDSSDLNSYQDDNGYYTGNVYYFKYEPLQWRVLDASEGLVMCNSAIDSQAYNNYVLYCDYENYGDSSKTYYASDYGKSSIRDWLNNDFYNTAFSSTQQLRIKGNQTIDAKSAYSSYDGTTTYDNSIFLLSYWDVINPEYGFSSSDTFDTARQLKSTDYAQCQGCYKDISTSYYGNSWWRLRSPDYSYGVADVSSDGIMDDCYDFVNVVNTGIVPAFKFKTIPSPEKLGDINGDTLINSLDALLVLQHTVKKITLTETQQKLADVNGDNLVNSNDAIRILEYAVGKRQEF